jgi:hypothetical protein
MPVQIVQMVLELAVQPSAAAATSDSPGGRAFLLIMQLMDLFDSADQVEREYIAWRMTQTANNFRFVADRGCSSSYPSSQPRQNTRTDAPPCWSQELPEAA